MKPRLILMGEPRSLRKDVSKKLSKFFEVPIFSVDDFFDSKSHKKEFPKNEFRFKLSIINACNDGFILCGLPLGEKELKYLNNINLCIFFNVDEMKAVNYNANRRFCPTCLRMYHLIKSPPLHNGRCDRCDNNLKKIPDDDPRTIKNRIFDWYKCFYPVLAKFKEDKKLLEIKSNRKISEISSNILSCLENKDFENKVI